MHRDVAANKATMRRDARRRPPQARHIWIYFTTRELAELVRGVVTKKQRREFAQLLAGPFQRIRKARTK